MKKLVLLFLIPAFFTHAQKKENPGDSLISFAKKQLGIKYRYAYSHPAKGFDCSGFIYYVFAHFNIKVPRTSIYYPKAGRTVPRDSARPGDIIVFTGTNPKIRKVGHVGIIVSQPGHDLQFIHSSSGNNNQGVVISNFTRSASYKKRFIKVIRLSAAEKILRS